MYPKFYPSDALYTADILIFTEHEILRWDPNFNQFLTNNFFKDYIMKRRNRGESNVLTNKFNHITNGNNNLITKLSIQSVLDHYKPGILGVAEPSHEDMRTMYFPGYRLVKGKLAGGKKIRLNVLVKDTLVDYSVDSFTSEVPSVLIKVNGFKYLLFV